MDQWKIITKPSEAGPGIYQEKMVIIAEDESVADKIRVMVSKEYPNAEFCEVPEGILAAYPRSFGFWINKHDAQVSMKDIKAGNIRKKVIINL